MLPTIPAPLRSRSHAIRALTVAIATLAMTISHVTASAAQERPTGPHGLLDALARVPATAATTDSLISYVDYRAVEAARAGALVPTSLADLLALEEADDPAAARWFAASMGIASGPGDLLMELFRGGPSWPTSVGFDFTDVDRAVAFGTPPSNGTVLLGDFDPAAIEAAYAARGYTMTPTADHSLLCSANGCDSGLDVDLANRDTSVPFGGRLGRQEPLAASAGELLSSADIGVVEDLIATAGGGAPALADDPAFRAVAMAPADDLTLIQATLLPWTAVIVGPDLAGMLGERVTPERFEALVAEFEALEPLPAPAAVAIIDGATETEQVVTVALAYATEDDASVAAEEVAERLRTLRSLTRDEPLSDLLDERGVTSVETRVEPPGADTSAAAVVELRAPLADDSPTPTGRLAASSVLYRLFVDLVMTRDLHWLTPSD